MIPMTIATGAAMAVLSLATAATAQTPDPAAQTIPIVTSAPTTPAPTLSAAAPADATAGQIAAWIGDDGDTGGKSVPGLVSAMPQRDRAIHGEVGVSIGSGGYRSAYGVVNLPIGENSDVTVAIGSQHQGGGNRGYGYGYGGYGRGVGNSQSLAVAVHLNGAGQGAPATDCAAAPKWSLGLPDDAALTNRCRRLMQGGDPGPQPR